MDKHTHMNTKKKIKVFVVIFPDIIGDFISIIKCFEVLWNFYVCSLYSYFFFKRRFGEKTVKDVLFVFWRIGSKFSLDGYSVKWSIFSASVWINL